MELNSICKKSFNNKKHLARIEKIKSAFIENEGYNPTHLFSSPGRAEILGNHTDHNNGLVMVSTISCDILAVVSKTNDNVVKICSDEYPTVTVDLSNLEVDKNEYGLSQALVRGIYKKISELGYQAKGFTAYTNSTIFKGAGVSSSAAFEVLVCEILNVLYLNGALSEIDKAIISQYAENVYFGKPCGLLDQSGISIGSLVKIDFENPTLPIVEKLSLPDGYTLVITNTGGNHAELTEHYASIRKEMETISNFFGKKVLREVDKKDFIKNLPSLKRRFSGRAILRALHYFNENERVLTAQNALVQNDFKSFLQAVNESGLSSLTLLQNCYVPGDVMQPIVLAIETSKEIIKDGAVRVHGGGFAGSIIAIVNDSEVKSYVAVMKNLFGAKNVFDSQVRKFGTVLVEKF